MKDDKIYRLLSENCIITINALVHIYNSEAIRVANYYGINMIVGIKLLRGVIHTITAEITMGFRKSIDLDRLVYEKMKDSCKQYYLQRRERAIQRLNNKRSN